MFMLRLRLRLKSYDLCTTIILANRSDRSLVMLATMYTKSDPLYLRSIKGR